MVLKSQNVAKNRKRRHLEMSSRKKFYDEIENILIFLQDNKKELVKVGGTKKC